jgi:hypothetical protein
MAKFTIKGYMRQVESAYKEAAAKIAKKHVELEALEREKFETQNSRMLTAQGKSEKVDEINNKIRAVKDNMAALKTEAESKAMTIRKTVENEFFDFYHVNPADVDSNMLTIINSGIATKAELMKLAETANPTMRRLIGQKLADDKDDPKTAQFGRALMMASNDPHLKAIDELRGIGKYATGGGMSGTARAQAFLDRWDEMAGPVFASAPKVAWSWDTTAGSGRHYVEGDDGEEA